ncbi:hypothetical protein N7516_002174 [Penicillium verrucosum]|uniref:uncharacterized protein n=1 Tax=Penicillium verrucosum TaxID=60171 RepID=UPI002544DB93|nr:uncharacterized protein N7516_002174 [Penicillium verrucosum]KAJ5942006.1 hypothetical protein N7516_002174 [Penicillium verrucosum]
MTNPATACWFSLTAECVLSAAERSDLRSSGSTFSTRKSTSYYTMHFDVNNTPTTNERTVCLCHISSSPAAASSPA